MQPRNLLIVVATALATVSGGVALGQAASDPEQRNAQARECKLPAPRTELERALQRKLRREMAKHPGKLPQRWVAGECSYGTAAVAP